MGPCLSRISESLQVIALKVNLRPKHNEAFYTESQLGVGLVLQELLIIATFRCKAVITLLVFWHRKLQHFYVHTV